MPGSCIFCRVVDGEIDAYKVYEDGETVAFLDIHPLSKGHTLVIPKAHVQQIESLSEEQSAALFKTVWKLTRYIQQATNTNASLIGINNGPESGQEVPHAHVHIVPRTRGDGGGPIHAAMRNRPSFSKDEMQRTAQDIRFAIQGDHLDS